MQPPLLGRHVHFHSPRPPPLLICGSWSRLRAQRVPEEVLHSSSLPPASCEPDGSGGDIRVQGACFITCSPPHSHGADMCGPLHVPSTQRTQLVPCGFDGITCHSPGCPPRGGALPTESPSTCPPSPSCAAETFKQTLSETRTEPRRTLSHVLCMFVKMQKAGQSESRTSSLFSSQPLPLLFQPPTQAGAIRRQN